MKRYGTNEVMVCALAALAFGCAPEGVEGEPPDDAGRLDFGPDAIADAGGDVGEPLGGADAGDGGEVDAGDDAGEPAVITAEDIAVTLSENIAREGDLVAGFIGRLPAGGVPTFEVISQSPPGAFGQQGSALVVADPALFDFEANPTMTVAYRATAPTGEAATAEIVVTLEDRADLEFVEVEPDTAATYLTDVSAMVAARAGADRFLLVSGQLGDTPGEDAEGGLSVFKIESNGSLTPTATLSEPTDLTSQRIRSMTSLDVAGKTYVVAIGRTRPGSGPTIHAVDVLELTPLGGLVPLTSTRNFNGDPNTRNDEIFDLIGLTTFERGGQTYVATAGGSPAGVRTYTVSAAGELTKTAGLDAVAVPDLSRLELGTGIAAVPTSAGVYLTISGGNGLFGRVAVGGDGALLYLGTLDRDTGRNAFVSGGVESVEVAGVTYAITHGNTGGTSGATDGFAVWELDAAGEATQITQWRDGPQTTLLDGIASVGSVASGGVIYVLGVGRDDQGASLLSFAPEEDRVRHCDDVLDVGSPALLESVSELVAIEVGGRLFAYTSTAFLGEQGLSAFEIIPPAAP